MRWPGDEEGTRKALSRMHIETACWFYSHGCQAGSIRHRLSGLVAAAIRVVTFVSPPSYCARSGKRIWKTSQYGLRAVSLFSVVRRAKRETRKTWTKRETARSLVSVRSRLKRGVLSLRLSRGSPLKAGFTCDRVEVVIRSVELYDLVKTAFRFFWFRLRLRRLRSSKSWVVGVESRSGRTKLITKPGNVHCG